MALIHIKNRFDNCVNYWNTMDGIGKDYYEVFFDCLTHDMEPFHPLIDRNYNALPVLSRISSLWH